MPTRERPAGAAGRVKGGFGLLVVLLVPVFAAEVVGGVDAEQIGDVGVEAVVEVQTLRS